MEKGITYFNILSYFPASDCSFRAYGTVYRAKHIPTNSILAIKTVPISRDSDTSTEITKEIEILKLCRHDNIVSLYGCAFVDDSLWVSGIFSVILKLY